MAFFQDPKFAAVWTDQEGFEPPILASTATLGEVEGYSYGACHKLAVALHRAFGWTLHVITDQDNRYWEDPADSDNWIPATVHVVALDAQDNAWDIRGCRPLGQLQDELKTWCEVGDYDSDRCHSEDGLRMYVGYWADEEGSEAIDRPLSSYTDEDIAEALEVAKRSLGHLPGFPVPLVAASPRAQNAQRAPAP